MINSFEYKGISNLDKKYSISKFELKENKENYQEDVNLLKIAPKNYQIVRIIKNKRKK